MSHVPKSERISIIAKVNDDLILDYPLSNMRLKPDHLNCSKAPFPNDLAGSVNKPGGAGPY